jgi:hypothetical protein
MSKSKEPSRRARWRTLLLLSIAIGLGLGALGGVAFASSYFTSRRNFATPYVGPPDQFECADIDVGIQQGPPASPAATVEARGTYGVFCGAGSHYQILEAQVQMQTTAGLCSGPVNTGYSYTTYQGYTTAPAWCGHSNYYSLGSAWMLIPGDREYSSTETNGGYPDISPALIQ